MNFYDGKHYDKSFIKDSLLNAINSDDWQEYFCINGDRERIKYSYSEEKVYSLSDIGRSGSCYDETLALKILHECLIENIDSIVDCIFERKRSFYYEKKHDKPIGFVVNERIREESDTTRIIFRREIGEKTRFGFFASCVHPIVENKWISMQRIDYNLIN